MFVHGDVIHIYRKLVENFMSFSGVFCPIHVYLVTSYFKWKSLHNHDDSFVDNEYILSVVKFKISLPGKINEVHVVVHI